MTRNVKAFFVKLLGVVAAGLLVAGCASHSSPGGRAVSTSMPDFFGIGENLAAQLKENHRNRLAGERLMMTTFVPLDSLSQSSGLGRLLAESLSTRLFSSQVQVVEIRKAREVLIVNDRGELILSRDSGRLADRHEVSAIVAGTYSLTPLSVIVNVRLLDAGSDEVLSVAGIEISRSAAINALLAGGAGLSDSELSVVERHGG